ncbi:hypothetical protein scyTo_0021539 [Scyliorhinus torazame]|uniref:C2 domain-containing protein n=1 Tax=Scyliorhinus torazame TaxID=75743 RepID=A0A401Q9U2_SCYTO|nr:hypothetical protein [Scyliorhinus torazame]
MSGVSVRVYFSLSYEDITNVSCGFLRSDKPVGTAQLKLDKLETECEVREIVEIFEGRKSTGGRLELKVQIREPLNGQDLQINTEKWLVLDSATRAQD